MLGQRRRRWSKFQVPGTSSSEISKEVKKYNPLCPHDALASFYIPENRLNFPTTKGFRTKISMKLVYQYVVILFNF